MTPKELADRTRDFAVRVARMVDALPRRRSSDVIGRQLLRSATSVGANYREACRARSKGDFNSKIGICQQETDESVYWMELIVDLGLLPDRRLAGLLEEGHELLAIFVASGRTSSARRIAAKEARV